MYDPTKITLIDHGDYLSDSCMGDVRVVKYHGKWAKAVRGDGGVWRYSAIGSKSEIVALAMLSLRQQYPTMFT